MKYSIILLSLLTLSAACKKKDIEPGEPFRSSGISHAIVNGSTYDASTTTATSETQFPGKLSVSMSVFINGMHRQMINLYCIDPTRASQQVFAHFPTGIHSKPRTGDSCLGAFYLMQDDAGENYYDVVDKARGNEIE